jgi:hypothetical protein
MRYQIIRRALSAASIALFVGMPIAQADDANVLYILDSSGSMWGQIAGVAKVETARQVLSATLRDLPAGAKAGLMAYGHRREADCSDVELVGKVAPINADALIDRINAMRPLGKTPLAESIKQSVNAFGGLEGQNNNVLLISDGIESCNGDPCAAAKEAREAGVGIKVHVVGFDLSEEEKQQLQCIADEGGGQFFSADSADGFTQAMAQAATVVAAAPEPAPTVAPIPAQSNLLSADNGGALRAASTNMWRKTNDSEAKNVAWLRKNEIGVYSFKDDQPATFDKFTVFIDSQHTNNLKDFELLVGDESPVGAFQSIGVFSTQNMKLMRTPHQEFTFEPVTARFLKVRLVAAHKEDENAIYGSEFQLFGEAAAAPEGAESDAEASTAINLRAPANGGELLAAPTDQWSSIIDGEEKEVAWLRKGQEAIFGFKGEGPATFEGLSIYIARTHTNNPNQVELMAGNEGPTGAFTSVGVFSTHNLWLTRDPHQLSTFAPVTARYVKLRLVNAHKADENAIYGTEIRLMGQLGGDIVETTSAPVSAPVADGKNLLAVSNGGALLAAPADNWVSVIDGSEQEVAWLRKNQEAVFGFQNDSAATIDGISIFIGRTHGNNPKEVELLVGSDGPTGAFQSVGVFSTQNMKMMREPHQRFSFAPVTAKVVKIRLVSAQSDNENAIYGTEIGVYGQLTDAAAVPAPPTVTLAGEGVNLLASQNGGALIAGPNDNWLKTIDGAETEVAWLRKGEEGIYAFKDDQPATFNSVAVFVGRTHGNNLKAFELFAGSDGPTGAFQSVGVFSTENMKMMRSPYQSFSFGPVTAKFVKIKLVSAHSENETAIYGTEFKLMGSNGP